MSERSAWESLARFSGRHTSRAALRRPASAGCGGILPRHGPGATQAVGAEVALVRAQLAAVEPRAHPLELARREAFCRWPVHGNVLEMLREGRLELGAHVLLEPGVWLTAMAPARIRIGGGSFLNLGVQVAAVDLVEIGEHCMFANHCFITDANHRFDDPDRPVPWQGFTSKGPTRVGDNVWCGANVVITSGVTIGERCVIGANSVVTTDLPPRSIAAGAPAKVLRTVEYPRPSPCGASR